MDYTQLTPENQAQMLTARLRQYEQQHYDATLNLELLTDTADETAPRVEALKQQIADLEKTIPIVKEKLAALPAAAPQPTPVRPRR